MTTLCKRIVLLLIVSISTLYSEAQTFTDGDFFFQTNNDGTCTLTGMVYTIFLVDLKIPSSATDSNGNNYRVTSIGHSAFFNKSGFTGSLTIPEGVKSIRSNAFRGCSGFTGPLTIPNSVTSIEDYAFEGCSGFTGSLTIPEGVKSITYHAFYGCSGFTGSLTIPEGVTSIGNGAFNGCNGFTGSLIIPESVTSIGDYAFEFCSGFIGSLTLGSGLERLGTNPFRFCNFTEINSLNPVPPTSITEGSEADVFTYSNKMALLSVPTGSEVAYATSPVWSGFKFAEIEATGITLDRSTWSTQQIGGTVALVATITPDNTTDKTVTWSSSAPAVASVDSNGKVTALATGTATITATTSNGLTASCTVTVVPQTGTIDGIDYEIVIGGGDDGKDIVKVTDGKTDPDGNLKIPDEIEIDGKKYPVTEIGDGAFKNRTDIRKLIIPAAVVTVGNEAFAGCTNLVEVEAEDGEKLLDCGTDAFKDAPIAVLYLGRDTSGLPFTGKDSLTDLTFGDKVTVIDPADFEGCTAIRNITVYAPVPPEVYEESFEDNVYETATLRVPDESVEDYKADEVWSKFFNLLGVSEIRPIEITMELADVELTEGESTTLKAIITPENATNKSVTWSSSDSSVASVDATGLVTALKAGTATITATTSNGLTASCTVTVVAKTIEATGLKLNFESSEIVEAQTLQLTATISPDEVTEKSVTWSSSDSSVASVDATGLVTAIKAGTATITATTSNGLTASCTVTVKARSAGIDGVDSEGERAVRVEGGNIIAPEGSEVFDLNGRKVAASGLRTGIYIVRIPGGKAVKIRL